LPAVGYTDRNNANSGSASLRKRILVNEYTKRHAHSIDERQGSTMRDPSWLTLVRTWAIVDAVDLSWLKIADLEPSQVIRSQRSANTGAGRG
jgi:hypothetical protein